MKLKLLEKNVLSNKKIKVILDTNLIISFLISKKRNILQRLFVNQKLELILSHELLDEFIEVTQRPKFQNYFEQKQVAELLQLIEERATMIQPSISLNIQCRDPKDNFLLKLALEAKADYLLTGDKDLLVLNPYEDTQILSFNDFQRTVET